MCPYNAGTRILIMPSPPHSLRLGMLRRLVLGGLLVTCLIISGFALAQAPGLPDDEPIPFPDGQGVVLEPFTSTTIPVGTTRIALTLQRPEGWTTHFDGVTLLLEPDPNPGDLGILAVAVDAKGSSPLTTLTSPDNVKQLLGSLLFKPRETERTTLQLGRREATLISFVGQFDNGMPARFMALHMTWDETVTVVVIAGASDRAFGPYSKLFRDVLSSVRVEPR